MTQLPGRGDAGLPYTAFATVSEFVLNFEFIPEQPLVPWARATLEGTLDSDGMPTSVEPPSSGRLSGCASQEALESVYVEVLSQTMWQVMASSGCQLDCATNGDGLIDGCTFELHWEAGEVVPVQEGQPDGG